jgi:hypothetical protein
MDHTSYAATMVRTATRTFSDLPGSICSPEIIAKYPGF